MRIENIREVKARLSQIVSGLPEEGSVVITKNGSVKPTGRRIHRIHSRIDTKGCNFPAEYGLGIQVGKGCCRSRVCKVIRRYIYGLN